MVGTAGLDQSRFMEGNYRPGSVGHGDDQIGSGCALTVVRSLSITSQPGGARALLNAPHLEGIGLAWLGQAGFALRYENLYILLDPYLSDYLEKKYRGTGKPHERLMAAPIQVQEVGFWISLSALTSIVITWILRRCQSWRRNVLRLGLLFQRQARSICQTWEFPINKF